MKTIKKLMALALCLAVPVMVIAADTETVTRYRVPGTEITTYTIEWEASAIAEKTDVTVTDVNKYLFMVVTDPDAAPDTPPDDNYSITITDERGLNVMGLESGANPLADVDTANTEDWVPKLSSLVYGARFIDGDLTLAFTELGTGDCSGVVVLYTLDPSE